MNSFVLSISIAFIVACSSPTNTTTETAESGLAETAEAMDDLLPLKAVTVTDDTFLVVPDDNSLTLYNENGDVMHSLRWRDVVDSGLCNGGCSGEGGSPDGDGLLFSYCVDESPDDTGLSGGYMRFSFEDGEFVPQWQREGFDSYLHDVTRDPTNKDGVLILETLNQQVSWFSKITDASPSITLNEDTDGWIPNLVLPNGFEQFSSQGRDFLLINWRQDSSINNAGGLISLWEITDPNNPVTVWDYPESGRLNEPHGAALRYYDGAIYLLYGHSRSIDPTAGQAATGTIGIAMTNDLLTVPTYMADINTAGSLPPMYYPRYAELTDQGDLIITDSGEFGDNSWVWKVPMPALTDTGKSGAQAVGGNTMNIIALDDGIILIDGLEDAFEAWLWTPSN